MNIKKIILTVLVILIIALIAVAIYVFFFQTSTTSGDPSGDGGSSSFLPFGIFGSGNNSDSNNTQNGDGVDTGGTTPGGVEPGPVSSLKQLVLEPVAGAFLYEDESGLDVVRYIERGTGHVFDVYPSSNKKIRISNTTLPQIQEVVWSNKDELFLRYLAGDGESIETYATSIVPPDTQGTSTGESIGSLLGGFMERDILSIATNRSGSSSFYITKSSSGSTGVLADSSGQNGNVTFSSPISEWLLSWPSQTTLIATTKPSHEVDGHTFTLNSSSGDLNWITGGISGLTVLPNNSISALLLASGVELAVFDINSGTTQEISLSTLPEKCVWSADNVTVYCGATEETPKGNYPDIWYQGLTLFSDSLWRIDTADQTQEQLFVDGNFGVHIDATHLMLDTDEEVLVFVDKNDLTLWVLFIPPSQPTTSEPSSEPLSEE